MRAFIGYGLIGVWVLFIIVEYFHLVSHENTVAHWIVQTAPLVIGLALVAPDVIDKVKELVGWVVTQLAKLPKIKISMHDDEKKGE